MSNSVLLIQVPETAVGKLRELRDFIQQSVRGGVLVLPEDATFKTVELPELGGVEVEPAGSEPSAAPQDITSAAHSPLPVKQDEVAEKRLIFNRLADYRKAHGLGCYEQVAEKTAHRKSDRLSVEAIRIMAIGESPAPIEHWRKIAKALDALEAADG